MRVKSLLGMEMPPPHEPGTIGYHQHYARFYRRNRLTFLPLIGLSGFMIWINADGVIAALGSIFHAGVIFFIGARWHAGGREIQNHRMLAWQVETQETMTAMLASGLYETPFDVLKALRDGPPAPGFKVKEWQDMHNESLAELRAAADRGEIPEVLREKDDDPP